MVSDRDVALPSGHDLNQRRTPKTPWVSSDHLTPKGQVDTETALSASLSALRGRFNV